MREIFGLNRKPKIYTNRWLLLKAKECGLKVKFVFLKDEIGEKKL